MRRLMLAVAVLAAVGAVVAAAPTAAAEGPAPEPWLACTLSIPPRCEVHVRHEPQAA